MLVLRRKAGEAIVLNGVITIHVLAVEGERVKLGISAPPEVVIVRSELLENQGQAGGLLGGSQAGGAGQPGREGFRPYRAPEREARPNDDHEPGSSNGQGRYAPRGESSIQRTTPLPIGGTHTPR
ncbi:MAG: carbon storage regulator [Ktedonobacterales bacterium]